MDKISPKKIVLAGGGSSSGHITPLIAVAQELAKNPVELLWIGDTSERTQTLASEARIRYVTIPTGKFHRYFTLENLKTPFLYWTGVRAARQILNDFQPDVVFAKGGSVSLPVVVAAHRLGIPVIIHESDAVMGLANRWAAKLANQICVSFPIENYPNLPPEKLINTGVPVRHEFFRVHAFKHHRPRLLVTGGGQGSVAINEVVFRALSNLIKFADVIHLTGERSFVEARKHVWAGYRPIAYAHREMAQLVADADLILSRASATLLAEIAVVGRPAILVPLPSAANDHQRANARAWQTAGAAMVILESDLTPDRLTQVFDELIANAAQRASMAKAARSLARPQAVKQIAKLIMDLKL